MAKERKSFLLRVDPKLHDALRRWADDDFRSLNAQVEMLLRQVVQSAGRLKNEEEQKSERTEEQNEQNQQNQQAEPEEPKED